MTDVVRVGVIGAGAIGSRHCHTLVHSVVGAQLVAVADEDGAAAERAQARFGVGLAATDYRALLDDPSVQAVVIATPNDTHARLVREAAAAGKHIFCEKPLGLDLATVDTALAEVAARGVALQVGFQRRFDRAHVQARAAIAAGRLGAVELVVATTRDPAPPAQAYLQRSGSFFADTAVHDYDAVRFLTGLEATEVFATGSTMHLEMPETLDTAVTTLRLSNGALAVITNRRRTAYGYEVAVEVSGSLGKVAVDQEQGTLLRTYSDRGVSHDHVDSAWSRFATAYAEEIVGFVDCVVNGRAPVASGDDGRRAVEIAVLAERSAREGRPLPIGSA